MYHCLSTLLVGISSRSRLSRPCSDNNALTSGLILHLVSPTDIATRSSKLSSNDGVAEVISNGLCLLRLLVLLADVLDVEPCEFTYQRCFSIQIPLSAGRESFGARFFALQSLRTLPTPNSVMMEGRYIPGGKLCLILSALLPSLSFRVYKYLLHRIFILICCFSFPFTVTGSFLTRAAV